MKKSDRYLYALTYRWLNALYDPLLRLTMREATFKRRLMEQAQIESGHRVLDLGCGTATLTLLIKQAQPKAQVIGLDGDFDILQLAKANVSSAGLDISLHQAMAFDLPYIDGSFDRIVCSLVFHHLARDAKVRTAKEVFRILRPGGELHVADFGTPQNALMFVISPVIRHFEEASDNIKGLLPEMFRQAGSDQVEEPMKYMTVLGPLLPSPASCDFRAKVCCLPLIPGCEPGVIVALHEFTRRNGCATNHGRYECNRNPTRKP